MYVLTGYSVQKVGSEKHVEVAVKTLSVQGPSSNTDIDKFYKREKTTLEVMRYLHHDHLIQAVAAYQRGFSRCFIFPWADGGNLRELWRKDKTMLDRDLITWALAQMRGISSGILALHRKGTRHGDLKPENILRFLTGRSSEHMGTLVIADVGLAKYHPDYTRERNIATTTNHGSRMYEPPDVLTKKPTSRRYDVWSLGCVFLEFVIWLVFGHGGPSGLRRFHEELVRDANIDRYWRNDPTAGLQVHPVVKTWIKEKLLLTLPAGCLLRDIVDLIDAKLLQPIDDRAYSKDLVKALDTIEQKRSTHNFDSCCSSFARDRNHRLVSEGLVDDPDVHLSKQVS